MSLRSLAAAALLCTQLAVVPALASDTELPEVQKRGRGETTLLIIPCMSCRWKSWDTFMERNAERYTMYAVTVPGFGGAPRPDLPINTEGTPWRDNLLQRLSELIDRENLRDIVIVGHSWGSMVAVQMAARRPDRISKMINVDGSLFMPVADTSEKRLQDAAEIVNSQSRLLADPENWRTFNGGQRNTLKPRTTPATMQRYRSILYHGMFMATDRVSLIQYWRENVMIDLMPDLQKIRRPVLNLQAFSGGDFEGQRDRYLKGLEAFGNPGHLRTVFLENTSHFVMEHRPQLLDRLIVGFLEGRPLEDSYRHSALDQP